MDTIFHEKVGDLFVELLIVYRPSSKMDSSVRSTASITSCKVSTFKLYSWGQVVLHSAQIYAEIGTDTCT